MIGITSCNYHVPFCRLEREKVGQAWARRAGKGERAAIYFDEDALTLAGGIGNPCQTLVDQLAGTGAAAGEILGQGGEGWSVWHDVFRMAATELPSLRANGSRERAPDDRLCEAIQLCAKKPGLLRRGACHRAGRKAGPVGSSQ